MGVSLGNVCRRVLGEAKPQGEKDENERTHRGDQVGPQAGPQVSPAHAAAGKELPAWGHSGGTDRKDQNPSGAQESTETCL